MTEAQQTTLAAEQLTIPQLQQQKQILEQEVSHLTDTVAKLKAAQQAYEMSSKALSSYTPENEDKEILVPLSNSVYVPGKAKDVKRVILNVGTGYFIDVATADAREHCVNKGNMLGANVTRFAKMLAQKRSHLDTCMQLLQYKINLQTNQ
jgi:prefoldin alpha subunit